MSLRSRISLHPADRDTLNGLATEYHYMHRPVHQRSCPFGWIVGFDGNLTMPDGKPCGFILYANIHYTRLTGEFGFPGLPTKWQVLSLARLWLHDDLPRNSETAVIAQTLRQTGHDHAAMVQRRWLDIHPPRYPDEPYHIRKVISYSDTRYHRGTIYRAANFREYGRTRSQKRHKNSRSPGLDGTELICFIYDLDKPAFEYVPAQPRLI